MGLILRNMSSSAGSPRINVTGSLYLATGSLSGTMANGGVFSMPQVSAVSTPSNARGIIFVASSSATPANSSLWFKSDAGTESDLIGGGNVDGSGTATYATYWTDSDTVAGNSGNLMNSTVFTKLTTDASADVLLESSFDSATAIKLLTNAGTAEQIVVTNTLGTNAAGVGINAGAAARTITMGNAASTAVNLNALASTITTVNALALTDGTATLQLAGTGATTLAAATTVDLDCTAAMSLNSSGGVINIGDDANANAINVGTGAAARVITVGNVTGATQVVLNAGTAGIALASTGAGDITINSDDTLLLDSDGVLELNSSSGAISVGNDAVALDLNFGSGAATGTIQVGNAARTAANVDALAVTVTSVNALSVTDGAANLAYDGAGAVTFTTVAYDHNASGAITIDGTSTISIDGAGALNIDTTSGALSVGTANSGIAVNIGHTVSETTVNDNLTVTGDLTVNGTTTTVDTTNLLVEDPVVLLASNAGSVNQNGGIAIEKGGSSLDMVIGRVANDTWGVGTKNTVDGTVTTLADMTLGAFRAGKLEIDGANDYIDVNTDFQIVAAASVTVNATAFEPSSAGGVTLGATDAEWGDVYIGDKSIYIGAGQEAEIGDQGGSLSIRSSEPIGIGENAVAAKISVGGDVATRTEVELNAILLDLNAGSGGALVNAAGASNFTTSAGSVTVSSEANRLFLTGAQGVGIKGEVAAANAVRIEASNAAGGIDVDAGTAGIAINATGGSHFRTSAGSVTVSSNANRLFLTGATGVGIAGGASEVDITTTGVFDVNVGSVDLDSTAGIAIDGTTVSIDGTDDSNVTVTGSDKDLTLAVVGGSTQTLSINSAGTGVAAIGLATSAGGITLDSKLDIVLDAEGSNVTFKEAGTAKLDVNMATDVVVAAQVADQSLSLGVNKTGVGVKSILALEPSPSVASAFDIKLGFADMPAGSVAMYPVVDNVMDLGGASNRFRNIYTGDLHLANDRGNWTVVEESDMLTLRNNLSGKWYRMAMEEIDPSGRDDGMNGAPPVGGDPDWEL